MAVGSIFAGGSAPFAPLRASFVEVKLPSGRSNLGKDWLRVHTPLRACPCARGSIAYFGAPVANLIQVNVGTPRSAEIAAAEDAQDVVFSGSIKKGRSLISDGNG